MFLDDQRPGAFERLVDRLLASPQYGEKWGRFSMIGGQPSKIFTLRGAQAAITDPSGEPLATREGGPPLALLQAELDKAVAFRDALKAAPPARA